MGGYRNKDDDRRDATQSGPSSSKGRSSPSGSGSHSSGGSSNQQIEARSSSSQQQVQPQQTWNFQAPAFQAIHYIPKSKAEEIRNYPVLEIFAIPHALLKTSGNHWCFYLVVGDDSSVRIDPTPSSSPGSVNPEGTKANIVIGLLPYKITKQAQHLSHLTVPEGLSVAAFIDSISKYGREKYEFNHLGQGCRKWTSDQISLFLHLGLLSNKDEADQAQDDILTEFARRKPTGRRYPLVDGIYYQ